MMYHAIRTERIYADTEDIVTKPSAAAVKAAEALFMVQYERSDEQFHAYFKTERYGYEVGSSINQRHANDHVEAVAKEAAAIIERETRCGEMREMLTEITEHITPQVVTAIHMDGMRVRSFQLEAAARKARALLDATKGD